MLKKLVKIVRKILFKILTPESIETAINDLRIQRCRKHSRVGSDSRFYETAKVFNYRKDASLINIGVNTHIRGELLIFANGGSINIGSNGYVGEGTRIWSANQVSIGDNVLISHNCNISDTDSHEFDHKERELSFKKLILNGHPTEKGTVKTKPITIEDNVWISHNVTIAKGVTIGKGAIIGASSVVTKDVEAFTLVAGNPAKTIRSIG